MGAMERRGKGDLGGGAGEDRGWRGRRGVLGGMGGWGKTGVASGMGVEMKDALQGGVGECPGQGENKEGDPGGRRVRGMRRG